MTNIGMESYTNNGSQTDSDREKELKALDSTKAGVKGLVDSGVDRIPKIFIQPADELSEECGVQKVNLQVPVIDLADIHKSDRHEEIAKEILCASEKWGFFQVVNHGIPLEILDKMLEGVQMFHEQDTEAKKEFYTRDMNKDVIYNTNYDLYKSKTANWRDTLTVKTGFTGHLDPQAIPPICRDVILDYISHVINLVDVLIKLLSRALGLRSDYLGEMECDKGWTSVLHYYPACPEPELTLGSGKHSDPSFITLLLQDQIGGLQVFHDNQWVDVQPVQGALVVNIGDILQMISNDILKSVFHRVKANCVGPRKSMAIFFTGLVSSPKIYGPLKELMSEENPPVYRDFTIGEYVSYFYSRPLNVSRYEHFKIQYHQGAGHVEENHCLNDQKQV